MDNRVLDQEEIEKRLSGVPRDFVEAFAVRVVMRVLPMLVRKNSLDDSFIFWGGN